MKRISTWFVGAIALALIVTAWQAVPGSATTATPTTDPHHPATATVDDPCATVSQGQHGGMMTPGAGMGMATPGAGMGMMGEFDLMFIDMMIPHHESAVVMAQIALTRAEHAEIRQLAEDIIASQSAEIAQMQEWRRAWYGDTAAMPMEQMIGVMGGMMQGMPGMGVDPMAMMAMSMNMGGELQALCTAPPPFDLAFITMMMPHHESAVAMARVALQHATHQEIKDLARAIIDAQQREIAGMMRWRAAWYGGTPVAA
jgi:uncharacterized protein (DUF305 family)